MVWPAFLFLSDNAIAQYCGGGIDLLLISLSILDRTSLQLIRKECWLSRGEVSPALFSPKGKAVWYLFSAGQRVMPSSLDPDVSECL